MASPDHAAIVREQLRHLGPWRGAIGEEALDALVAALAQAEHERDQAISVREVEWRMSAKEINAAAIDRAERAERQRDRAIEALRNGMECGETVAIRAWCACVLANIEKEQA